MLRATDALAVLDVSGCLMDDEQVIYTYIHILIFIYPECRLIVVVLVEYIGPVRRCAWLLDGQLLGDLATSGAWLLDGRLTSDLDTSGIFNMWLDSGGIHQVTWILVVYSTRGLILVVYNK